MVVVEVWFFSFTINRTVAATTVVDGSKDVQTIALWLTAFMQLLKPPDAVGQAPEGANVGIGAVVIVSSCADTAASSAPSE